MTSLPYDHTSTLWHIYVRHIYVRTPYTVTSLQDISYCSSIQFSSIQGIPFLVLGVFPWWRFHHTNTVKRSIRGSSTPCDNSRLYASMLEGDGKINVQKPKLVVLPISPLSGERTGFHLQYSKYASNGCTCLMLSLPLEFHWGACVCRTQVHFFNLQSFEVWDLENKWTHI